MSEGFGGTDFEAQESARPDGDYVEEGDMSEDDVRAIVDAVQRERPPIPGVPTEQRLMPAETTEGVVNATNDNGFTLEMQEGWINYSKRATPPPPKVERGQRVRVAYTDGQGGSRWANKIEVLTNGSSPAAVGLDKDVHIVREVCLKAAVELAIAEKGDKLNLSAIFGDAELMEAWVLREGEPEPEPEPEPAYGGP